MKKLLGLLIISVFLMVPFYAGAGVIGDVDLKASWGGDKATVYYGTETHKWYLDYAVSIDGAPKVEAFCVDYEGVSKLTENYTLLEIDEDLDDYGFDVDDYFAASWVADNYLDQKGAAQLAIWEIVFDSDNNLSTGFFKAADSAYKTDAQAILDELMAQKEIDASGYWALAINPAIGDQNNGGYQNYLVPVPEPAQMILLGTALIGLAGIGRKKFFKK